METKVCKKCGQELPLSNFVKDKRMQGGYKNTCKSCFNKHQREYMAKVKQENKPQIKDAPAIEPSIEKELNENNLALIPSRLLISELRRRGYRGELELVTIQKVVI
jgi:hypothetical protein